MMRVRSTVAGLVLAGLFTLACPPASLAGGPYSLEEVTIINAKVKPGVTTLKNWVLPGAKVLVRVKVHNDGAAPQPQETIQLWSNLEFVPGPGQSKGQDQLLGKPLKPPPPPSNQTYTYLLSFPAPTREGLYMVRMNLTGGPAAGYYLGHSTLFVQSERPALFVRKARVLKYSNWKCGDSDSGGFAFPPTPLVPVPPTVLGSQGQDCTPPDQARVKVENAGSKTSKPFKVTLFDFFNCYAKATMIMPAIKPGQSAWTPKPVTLQMQPSIGSCSGHFQVTINPAPDDGGSVDASEITFTDVWIYKSNAKNDTAQVNEFLANN